LTDQFTLNCVNCGWSVGVEERSLRCLKCAGQMLVHYDYEAIREGIDKIFDGKISNMWKYSPLLPVLDGRHIVSLAEGGTRLLKCTNLAHHQGLSNMFLKVEAWNPTGSHKDRQISLATSKAVELGYKVAITSSSGNVGASVAAYTSKAGIVGFVMVPNIAPDEKLTQIAMYGGRVVVVDTPSNIEVAALVARIVKELGMYDMVTAGLHNPYMPEGCRTIAFELFEQMRPLPDVVVMPVGGGGLIGSLWRGFRDLVELGLVDKSVLPRLVGVQAEGCAPFVKAVQERWTVEKVLQNPWAEIRTICNAIADTIPLDALIALPAVRESGGTAIAVSDDEALEAERLLSSMEGVFAEPSSATTVAAVKRLVDEGWIERGEKVVCLITGTGFKDLVSIKKVIRPPSRIPPTPKAIKEHVLEFQA
jgi:threonine synthase